MNNRLNKKNSPITITTLTLIVSVFALFVAITFFISMQVYRDWTNLLVLFIPLNLLVALAVSHYTPIKGIFFDRDKKEVKILKCSTVTKRCSE
jgi:hypothetical protein